MPLADFKPTRQEIEYPGGSFAVRAITLMDVAVIVESHTEAVQRIYTSIQARSEFAESDIGEFAMDVIRECPMLVATIIALAADEHEQMSSALALPMPVQVDAIRTIGTMTFKDLASVKKFIADAAELVKRILPTTPEATARKRGRAGR